MERITNDTINPQESQAVDSLLDAVKYFGLTTELQGVAKIPDALEVKQDD